MYTTITIKTNKVLRDEAKAVADKLGVPLTTVINAYLAEFIRERRFSVSLEPAPSKKKIKLWESISSELDKSDKSNKEKNRAKISNTGFSDADKLISHLKI